MYKLAPSILSADFTRLGEQIKEVEEAGAAYIHIDVMDGMFVPAISFGLPIIKSIRGLTNQVFDVHLMVQEPIRFIDEYAEAGADIITVHAEACTHLNRTVARIKELGKRAGVSINPATPLSCLDYIIEEVDMILIMSVNPGFGGQKFIPSAYRKIQELKEMIFSRNLSVDIEVDGGITKENVGEVMKAGANVVVAGTSVFSGCPMENIRAFHNIFEQQAPGI